MPVAPDDPRLQKCGFAKLLGEGVEYYMRKYEVVLGRRSKSASLDVVLGDNMNISREHAKIVYNFDTHNFELIVYGKNGVTVGKTLHTPSSPPAVLHSQDLIAVGDRSFYFLLPKDIKVAKKRKRAPPSVSPQPSGVVKPAKVALKKPRVQPSTFKEQPAAANSAQQALKFPSGAADRQYTYGNSNQRYTNEEPAEAYEGEDEEHAEVDDEMQYDPAQDDAVDGQYDQGDEPDYADADAGGGQEYTEGGQDYAEPYEGEDDDQGHEHNAFVDAEEDEDEQDAGGQPVSGGQHAYGGYGAPYYAANGAYR